MDAWNYYLLEHGNGEPYEIYRLRDNGNGFYGEHAPGDLYLARSNGSWSNASEDIRGFLSASHNGDFDPDEGEITEATALSLLSEWQTKGPWPGRP
jgi:hypothetical protein